MLRKLGCPESFVDPETVRRKAKARGMDLVVVTDHNTLAGSLELAAKHDDVFTGVEITAFFPEDRCKTHILAWNIDEATFAEADKLRENLFELAPFLREQGVMHACAHPLYGVNNRLTIDHFERLLLLFDVLELNGARDGDQNEALRAIVEGLDRDAVHRLAEKHRLPLCGETPWIKRLIGGSDDHGGLNIARMFTEVPDLENDPAIPAAKRAQAFFAAVLQGRAKVCGEAARPRTMAYNLYGIGWQFYKDKYDLGRWTGREPFLHFLDGLFSPEATKPGGAGRLCLKAVNLKNRLVYQRRSKPVPPKELNAFIHEKALEVFYADKLNERGDVPVNPGELPEDLWFRFADKTVGAALAHHADKILADMGGVDFFDFFQTVASAGALYTLLSPFFTAHAEFSKDKSLAVEALARFSRRPKHRPAKLVHFSDVFHDGSGAALWLKENMRRTAERGLDYTVLTCSPKDFGDGPGLRAFRPVGVWDCPEYPDLKLFYPPILRILDYVHEKGFTRMLSATPGPMGLAALLVSRILRLPLSGVFHASLPGYVYKLTGDEVLQEQAWKYIVWYYNQMDTVFAPSGTAIRELARKGVKPEKLRLLPRGVDLARFHPGRRNGFYDRLILGDGPKLLYVGRVAREKNIGLIEAVGRELAGRCDGAKLIVVGEGPESAGMRERLKDAPVHFMGELGGDDLAAAYASADLFLYPCTVEAHGRVVLEALASGAPVLAAKGGGPAEFVSPGLNGETAETGAFVQAALALLDEPAKLFAMRRKAREGVRDRCAEAAFAASWRLFSGDEKAPAESEPNNQALTECAANRS